MPSPARGAAGPPSFLGPDLFNPPAHRGWISLTPSVSLSGEYNDNLFLTGRDRTDDFITTVTPAFTLSMQRPHYRLLAGYDFSAEFYANESQNNGVARRQQFFADAFYDFSPGLTFTLSDTFVLDRESNVVTTSGISAGRRQAFRNTVSPALQWQTTQRTSLNFSASHTLVRYEGSGTDALDSDTYRVGVGAGYSFTRRLEGTADMAVGVLDVETEPTTVTYTPQLGFAYQITPTLLGSISAGPSVAVGEDDTGKNDTTISPAVSVGLEQSFKFGSLTAGYDRAITAESFGVADRQTVFASLWLPTLWRGFQFEVTARFTRADEDLGGDRTGSETDVATVDFQVSYQIARNISLIGSYVYYNQSGRRGVEDVHQNRVFLGLQYAYPINFD